METDNRLMFFTDHAKKNLELIFIRTEKENRAFMLEQIISTAAQVAQVQGFLLVHSEHIEQARAILNRQAV